MRCAVLVPSTLERASRARPVPAHRKRAHERTGRTRAVHIDAASGCLTMTGRLDTRSTPLLYDAVSALLATDQPEWTMDVTRLTVADHAGLRAMDGPYHRGVRHGRRITAQGSSPGLQHAVRWLRLDRPALPAERGQPVNKVTGG